MAYPETLYRDGRCEDCHMMRAATRARRSPRAARESKSRSTCWGFQ